MTTRRLTETETTLWAGTAERIRDHGEVMGVHGDEFRRRLRREVRDQGPGHYEILSHDGVVLDAIDVDE